jgi:hypothetical protein
MYQDLFYDIVSRMVDLKTWPWSLDIRVIGVIRLFRLMIRAVQGLSLQ